MCYKYLEKKSIFYSDLEYHRIQNGPFSSTFDLWTWSNNLKHREHGVLQKCRIYFFFIFFYGNLFSDHKNDKIKNNWFKKSLFKAAISLLSLKIQIDFTLKLIYLLKYRSNRV